MRRPRSPLVVGALYALIAAAAFGVTTPLVARYATTLGPWTIAALLYAGAALVAGVSRAPANRERRARVADVQRIAAAGIVGAMLAPAALAWGLRHASALAASLTLTLEAVFTVAIAAAIFHEHVGRRVALASITITAGAALLALGAPGGTSAALGLGAVALAALLWSVDNAITGTVADVDPGTVVLAKSAVGASCAAIAVLVLREPPPGIDASLALVAIGAVGHGASLRWYLYAQRTFGVARTASVFASAPFVGAATAFALGDRGAGTQLPLALAAIAAGVLLHLTEHHGHRHRHQPLDHEHAHTHGDDHHLHAHPGDIAAEPHSHPHHHEGHVHAHAHGPDAHHAHAHPHAGDENG
jgi:drug/metabolite transporter (DMT)-like permease